MKIYIAGGKIPDLILKRKVNILFSFALIYIPDLKWGAKNLFKKYTLKSKNGNQKT